MLENSRNVHVTLVCFIIVKDVRSESRPKKANNKFEHFKEHKTLAEQIEKRPGIESLKYFSKQNNGMIIENTRSHQVFSGLIPRF